MSKELIRLVDCCMAFDDELVLDHLNLTIDNSEFLTLLGSSGCGKTTTLRIIGGFLTPTSGTVYFDGAEINAWYRPISDDQYGISKIRPLPASGRI